jgi:hypothetical protein
MSGLQLLRKFVPPPLKRFMRRQHRRWTLRTAVDRLRSTSTGSAFEPAHVEGLIYGWGNEGFSASVELIQEILDTADSAGGPILECGSGLSTLVLGLAAGRHGRHVLSLENDAKWARRTKDLLARFGVDGVDIVVAPVRSFGDYAWYDVPMDDLPAGIDLAVCDGPCGDTLGGRYGLLPRTRQRLAPGCTILLDDAGRPGEKRVLRRWAAELGCEYEILGTEKPFARLTLPSAT